MWLDKRRVLGSYEQIRWPQIRNIHASLYLFIDYLTFHILSVLYTYKLKTTYADLVNFYFKKYNNVKA